MKSMIAAILFAFGGVHVSYAQPWDPWPRQGYGDMAPVPTTVATEDGRLYRIIAVHDNPNSNHIWFAVEIHDGTDEDRDWIEITDATTHAAPALVRTDSGVELFVTGTDGQIWQTTMNNRAVADPRAWRFQGWQNLPALGFTYQTTLAPAVTYVQGNLYLFAVDTRGHMIVTRRDPSNRWTTIELPGSTQQGLHVTRLPNDHIVFAHLGGDGTYYGRFTDPWNPSFEQWIRDTTAVLTTAPALQAIDATQDLPQERDSFVVAGRAADAHVWTATFTEPEVFRHGQDHRHWQQLRENINDTTVGNVELDQENPGYRSNMRAYTLFADGEVGYRNFNPEDPGPQ